ncbi:MAG: ATP-binding cassette domain-containing protein, partial [Verrucomicrobiales bacterium]
DFRAAPGKTVALVGASGAGKSTVAALLMRLYDPGTGEIRFDGEPASAYPLAWLRGQMALVPQEVLLFSGSVAENIAYGKPGATRAEIEAAAKLAHAHDFIAALPAGYETRCGERGAEMSGGQRQRLALARALLKDPAILILDEATSALDAESERQIQGALETAMRGRTTFIIAHRLSTVRQADQILVVKAGRIAERGTHDELIAAGGFYRLLCEQQLLPSPA